MRFRSKRENRRTLTLLWVLCTIGTLFSRICYDSVQADSSLTYADPAPVCGAAIDVRESAPDGMVVRDSGVASGYGMAVPADSECAPADGRTGISLRSAFCAAPRGVPAQQVYVSETSSQSSTALIPRKTAQRINPRGAAGNTDGVIPPEIFTEVSFAGRSALSSVGLCEVTSQTVILLYIHSQDGEKA